MIRVTDVTRINTCDTRVTRVNTCDTRHMYEWTGITCIVLNIFHVARITCGTSHILKTFSSAYMCRTCDSHVTRSTCIAHVYMRSQSHVRVDSYHAPFPPLCAVLLPHVSFVCCKDILVCDEDV